MGDFFELQWSTLRTKLKGPKIFFVVSVLRRKLFDRNLKEIIIQQVRGRFHRLVHSFTRHRHKSRCLYRRFRDLKLGWLTIIYFKSIPVSSSDSNLSRDSADSSSESLCKRYTSSKSPSLGCSSELLSTIFTCMVYTLERRWRSFAGEGLSLPANQRLRWCL